jgi:hypothetical protein
VTEAFPAGEHLFIDSYFGLCEGLPLYYMSTEGVYDFFRKCEQGEVGPCVLVSAACDYSIREQDAHHPNIDLYAHAMSFDYRAAGAQRTHYEKLQVGPAADPQSAVRRTSTSPGPTGTGGSLSTTSPKTFSAGTRPTWTCGTRGCGGCRSG